VGEGWVLDGSVERSTVLSLVTACASKESLNRHRKKPNAKTALLC